MSQRKGEKTKRQTVAKLPGLARTETATPTPSSGPRTAEGRRSRLPKAPRGLDPQLTAEGSENREPRTRRKSSAARPGNPGSAGYPGPFKATAHTRRCRCAPRTLTPLQQQDINCSRVPNANCNNFCRELFFFTLFIVENLGHKECKSLKNSSYVFSIDIVTRRRRA